MDLLYDVSWIILVAVWFAGGTYSAKNGNMAGVVWSMFGIVAFVLALIIHVWPTL